MLNIPSPLGEEGTVRGAVAGQNHPHPALLPFMGEGAMQEDGFYFEMVRQGIDPNFYLFNKLTGRVISLAIRSLDE